LVSLWQLYVLFIKETTYYLLRQSRVVIYAGRKNSGCVPVRMHTFYGTSQLKGFCTAFNFDGSVTMFGCHKWLSLKVWELKNDLLAYKITNKPLKIMANGNVNGIDTVFF
jgi:hypothetical protein